MNILLKTQEFSLTVGDCFASAQELRQEKQIFEKKLMTLKTEKEYRIKSKEATVLQ